MNSTLTLPDDPSDWPNQFQELRTIDSLLRCSICLEYFNIAMVVPGCSHNYCSLCIRKHITDKQKCPTCSIDLFASDIKCNRVLDEMVNQFTSLRAKLLEIVRQYVIQGSTSVKERPIIEMQDASTSTPLMPSQSFHDITVRSQVDSEDSEPLFVASQTRFRTPHKRSTNVSSRSNADLTPAQSAKHNMSSPFIPSDSSKISESTPSKYEAENKDENKASCPVCGNMVVIDQMNIHLDKCLMQPTVTRAKRSRPSSPDQSSEERTTRSSKRKKQATESQTQTKPATSKAPTRSNTRSNTKVSPGCKEDDSANDVALRVAEQGNIVAHSGKNQVASQRQTANDLILASSKKAMRPIANMACAAMSEKNLRAKAKSFGLNSKGDKKALSKRIKAYILLHNAQCDSTQPMTAEEVAHKVDADEATRSKHGYTPNVVPQTFDHRHSKEAKEEFKSKYSKEHENEFRALIDQVKKHKAKTRSSSSVKSDTAANSTNQMDSMTANSASTVTTTRSLHSVSGEPTESINTVSSPLSINVGVDVSNTPLSPSWSFQVVKDENATVGTISETVHDEKVGSHLQPKIEPQSPRLSKDEKKNLRGNLSHRLSKSLLKSTSSRETTNSSIFVEPKNEPLSPNKTVPKFSTDVRRNLANNLSKSLQKATKNPVSPLKTFKDTNINSFFMPTSKIKTAVSSPTNRKTSKDAIILIDSDDEPSTPVKRPGNDVAKCWNKATEATSSSRVVVPESPLSPDVATGDKNCVSTKASSISTCSETTTSCMSKRDNRVENPNETNGEGVEEEGDDSDEYMFSTSINRGDKKSRRLESDDEEGSLKSSGLSAEISYLVDRAIDCSARFDSSDDEESQSLIPNAPLDITFS